MEIYVLISNLTRLCHYPLLQDICLFGLAAISLDCITVTVNYFGLVFLHALRLGLIASVFPLDLFEQAASGRQEGEQQTN